MIKYYLIPITDKGVFFNGELLRDILKNTYPYLLKREMKRIQILYSTSPLITMPMSEQKRYNAHNKKTKKLIAKKSIPEYIIAIGDDFYAEEIITRSKINVTYSSTLEIRKVSEDEAKAYYNSFNYKRNIINYYKNCYLKYLNNCSNKEQEWQYIKKLYRTFN